MSNREAKAEGLNFESLAPALFVVLWATGFIGARFAMPWAEPFTFLGLRFAIAAALIGIAAFAMRTPLPSRAEAVHSAIAGALMHGVYLGAVFWSIRHGMPAGISALIMGLQPLLTALIAGPALDERVTPRHWLGLFVGLAGVVIVLLPKLGSVAGGITPATLGAMSFALVGMSLGAVWQKKFVPTADLLGGTLWQYCGATVLMTFSAFMLETREVTVNGELVFAMTWLVLVLSIGAIFLLMRLIRAGAISKVSSLFYLVPAVTALMGWALFGETLTLVQIGGMAVAAAGVALATQRPTARARASR